MRKLHVDNKILLSARVLFTTAVFLAYVWLFSYKIVCISMSLDWKLQYYWSELFHLHSSAAVLLKLLWDTRYLVGEVLNMFHYCVENLHQFRQKSSNNDPYQIS